MIPIPKWLKNTVLIEILIATFISFFVAYIQIQDVLENPEISVADKGDGLGTTGYIFNLADLFEKYGFRLFYDNSINLAENIGFGLTRPAPGNLPWKIYHALSGSVMSVELAYDFGVFLIMALSSLAMFILLRTLKIPYVLAMIGGLLIMQSEALHFRTPGHLFGLGAIFSPIFVTAVIVYAAQKANWQWFATFGVAMAFGFSFNEYFGYFGSFYWLGLGTLLFFHYSQKDFKTTSLNFLKLAPVTFLTFLAMMAILYWDMLIVKDISGSTVSEKYMFDRYTFKEYSTPNPGYLIHSALPFLRWFHDHLYFARIPGEFGYRIGMVPVFLMAIFIGFQAVRSKWLTDKDRSLSKLILIFLITGAFVATFGLHPKSGISMVPFTWNNAPMFRVGVRAFLFANISLVVISMLILGNIWNTSFEYFKKSTTPKTRIIPAIGMLFVTSGTYIFWADVVGTTDHLFTKIYRENLPEASGYSVLENMPREPLLELPFWSPVNEPPELNYIYSYNRALHKKPIVNTPYHLPHYKKYRNELQEFSEKTNRPTPDFIEDLAIAGIHYIVANKKRGRDYEYLREFQNLSLIFSNDIRDIYLIRDVPSKQETNFLELFVQRTYTVD